MRKGQGELGRVSAAGIEGSGRAKAAASGRGELGTTSAAGIMGSGRAIPPSSPPDAESGWDSIIAALKTLLRLDRLSDILEWLDQLWGLFFRWIRRSEGRA